MDMDNSQHEWLISTAVPIILWTKNYVHPYGSLKIPINLLIDMDMAD